MEKHDTEDDCWIVVKGKVYDVNKYLAEGLHPGGNASITMNAGVDSTEDFEAVHSAKAWKQLEEFAIGYLDPKDDPNAAAANHASTAQVTLTAAPIKSEARAPRATGPVNLLQYALDHPEMYGDTLVGEQAEAAAFDRMWAGARAAVAADAPVSLNPKKWVPLEVDAKVPLSHDTILLRLKLDSAKHQCGLPVGYHVYLRGEKNGEPGAKKVMRADELLVVNALPEGGELCPNLTYLGRAGRREAGRCGAQEIKPRQSGTRFCLQIRVQIQKQQPRQLFPAAPTALQPRRPL